MSETNYALVILFLCVFNLIPHSWKYSVCWVWFRNHRFFPFFFKFQQKASLKLTVRTWKQAGPQKETKKNTSNHPWIQVRFVSFREFSTPMSSLVKDDCRSCFRTFQRFECNDCQGGGVFPWISVKQISQKNTKKIPMGLVYLPIYMKTIRINHSWR